MMYAFIKNGAVVQYPYSVTDLRRAMPNVSFPRHPSAETLAAFDVYEVAATPAPTAAAHQTPQEATPVFNVANQRWEQVWGIRDKTPEEADSSARQLRNQRNEMLTACDWTQLEDAPVDKAAWALYRQALREVTAQTSFPWAVVWPDKPL